MKLLEHLAEEYANKTYKTFTVGEKLVACNDFLAGAKAVLDILRSKEAHDLNKDAIIHPKGWAKIINAMKAEE